MVSIIFEYVGMVLDCPCLALEAQILLFFNLVNKPTTKCGNHTTTPTIPFANKTKFQFVFHDFGQNPGPGNLPSETETSV